MSGRKKKVENQTPSCAISSGQDEVVTLPKEQWDRIYKAVDRAATLMEAHGWKVTELTKADWIKEGKRLRQSLE